jgi:hypothetical protein
MYHLARAMSASQIFIGYAAEDRESARRVALILTEVGWSVWWDSLIAPGEEWPEKIENALRNARCVVILWSSYSKNSRWVRKEARSGDTRGVLVPVVLEPDTIPWEFDHVQAAPLVGWNGEADHPGIAALTSAISRILAPQDPSQSVPADAPDSTSQNKPAPFGGRVRAKRFRERLNVGRRNLLLIAGGSVAGAIGLVRSWGGGDPAIQPKWTVLPPFPNQLNAAAGGSRSPVHALEVFGGSLVAGLLAGGIHEWVDSGTEWRLLGGDTRPRKVLCLRTVGQYLFAGFDSSGTPTAGLAMMERGGAWVDRGLNGFFVRSIDNDGIRLRIGTYGAFFAADAWSSQPTAVMNGLPPDHIAINAVRVTTAGTYVGMGRGLYFLGAGQSVWRLVPGSDVLDIHDISSDNANLYVATTSDGVVRLPVGGTRLEQSRGLPENVWVKSIASGSGLIFAGTMGAGVWISYDGGVTWSAFNTSLVQSAGFHALRIRQGTQLYAGSDDGRVYMTELARR